jgi:aquaporin Z
MNLLLKLFVELIGSFIFFYVILQQGQAIPIGVALAAMIYFGGAISGGHFNPGVSLMMFLNGKMPSLEFVQYVLVQAVAAAGAVYFGKLVAVPATTAGTI